MEAKPAVPSPAAIISNTDKARELATEACLRAIDLMFRNYSDKDGKPLSAMAMALVKRCNGHPFQTICDMASQMVLKESGKNRHSPAGPMSPIPYL
jgi:hypothetical protein